MVASMILIYLEPLPNVENENHDSMTGAAASNQTRCGIGKRLIEWIQLIFRCILLITVKSRFAPASVNCQEA